MDYELCGKTAIITGGTSGIGFACAKLLASEGAKIILVSRSKQNGTSAVARIIKAHPGADVSFVGCDLGKPSEVKKLQQHVENQTIDILVGSSGGPSASSATELTESVLATALTSNLLSLIDISKFLVENMALNQWGRIVFITTSGVKQPMQNLAASNIARSALTSFAKTLSGEVGKDGITVNCVMPGKIETERLVAITKSKAKRASIDFESQCAKDVASIPAGRFGTTIEIASLVTFLCSQNAAYVNGTNIPVDGGMISTV